MALSPETIDAMIAAGLSAEQIGAVVKADLLADRAKEEARAQERKATAAERQRRKRRKDGLESVTPKKRDEALPTVTGVTARDTRDPSPPSPNPPGPPNTPPLPSRSDPDGSAELRPALSPSDRLWTEFPRPLADLSKRSEHSVRTWLGKVLREHTADAALEAVEAAVQAGTGDPFGYVTRVLKPIAPKARGSPYAHPNDDYDPAEIERRLAERQRANGRHP